jgi:SAM-dependent methyltransferase
MSKLRHVAHKVASILSTEPENRSAELVTKESDQGAWLRQLRRVHEYTSLEEYLFEGNQFLKLCRPGTYRTQLIPMSDYLRAKAGLLQNLLNPYSSVCELGCGAGWNLIAMRFLGFQGPLSGVDISPVGIQVVEEANAKWDLNINCVVGDISSKQTFSTELVQNSDCIFSFLALEQLPRESFHTLTFIRELLGEKKVFLLESSSGVFPFHYSEILTGIYTKKRDYLRTMRAYLDELSISYRIKRLNFSPSVGNDVVLWELLPDSN